MGLLSRFLPWVIIAMMVAGLIGAVYHQGQLQERRAAELERMRNTVDAHEKRDKADEAAGTGNPVDGLREWRR